jgi:hypothetical protein
VTTAKRADGEHLTALKRMAGSRLDLLSDWREIEVQIAPHVWLVPTDGRAVWNWVGPNARRLKNVLYDVMHWQKRQGLIPDGLIGPASWQKRDGRLRRLARRCRVEFERAGLTHLHTYRTIGWLLKTLEAP